MATLPAQAGGSNPRGGVIFERATPGNPNSFFRATLNDDLTVTVQDAQTIRTVSVGVLYSLGALQSWAARCFYGEEGLKVGPVGLRMAANFARHELACALSA